MKSTHTKPKKSPVIIIATLLVILTFVLTLFFYSALPDNMAAHWGISGKADGYSSKEVGAWIIPILSIGILILLYFIPLLDPLKKNIEKFRSAYHALIAVLCGFFLYLQIIILALNLGLNINMGQLIVPALGILFFIIGVILKKTKRNYFIGIRTPWTLYSDKVWDDTHKIGAKLFKTAGIITFLGVFVPQYSFFLLLASIIAASVITIAYSYKSFKSQKK